MSGMYDLRTPRQVYAILADHNGVGPEYAVLECGRCPASVRIEDSAGRSDDDLGAEFRAMGWSIRPTLCPSHPGSRRQR